MMISPKYFNSKIQHYSLKELIKERDYLLAEIEKFESKQIPAEEYQIAPSPEVIYKCNLEYLEQVTSLIDEKTYQTTYTDKIQSITDAEHLEKYSTRSFKHIYCEQALRYVDERPKHVQAYVSNIAFPKSLDELKDYVFAYGCFDHEGLLLGDSETNWTAPKWTKIGDIVFFMHAKYAIKTITALRTELKQCKNHYSEHEYKELMKGIEKGIELHQKIGGKIFAIAQVCGSPEYVGSEEETGEDLLHFKSRIYVDMDNVTILENPIDIAEFRDFITISRQSAITPVHGNSFTQLKNLIATKNNIPKFLKESDATPLPLSHINQDNWMSISNEYRRAFMLESQFRSYYVDYLLKSVGDRKTVWKECRCRKTGIPDSFIDNVIFISGKYLPVEVKLSIHAQNSIKAQVRKYCDDDYILLDGKENKRIRKEKVYTNNCLVIDTDHIYIYNYKNDSMISIFSLDLLKTKENLSSLKSIITNSLIK